LSWLKKSGINRKKLFITTLLFTVLFFLPSCSNKFDQISNQVVIGIDSDVESPNPLFSFSGYENNISELLYLKLVQSDWDDENGTPAFARHPSDAMVNVLFLDGSIRQMSPFEISPEFVSIEQDHWFIK